jgi:hypothetical protein
MLSLALIVCGALVLPAQSDDLEAGSLEDPPLESPALEVARLRQDLAALTAATAAVGERPSPELMEQLKNLRQEIDALLALLSAQGSATERPVERVDSGAPATDLGSRRPGTPRSSGEPTAEAAANAPPTPTCAELAAFDSNEDGVVSGLDRYWRYFRLWVDDGDGAIEDRELSGLYDAGIQELTARLGTYRTLDGYAGDVLRQGRIRLAPGGRLRVEAPLALDADRLARGGELELQDGAGARLTGVQVLTTEMQIARADQPPASLSCP